MAIVILALLLPAPRALAGLGSSAFVDSDHATAGSGAESEVSRDPIAAARARSGSWADGARHRYEACDSPGDRDDDPFVLSNTGGSVSLTDPGGSTVPSHVLGRLGLLIPTTSLSAPDQNEPSTGSDRASVNDVGNHIDPNHDPRGQQSDPTVGDAFTAYGSAGSWWKTWFAAAAVASRRDGEQYHAGWEANYFVADNFSMNFGISGIFFDQPERDSTEDAVGGNLTLLFRWNFLTRDRWTMFFDGGAGLLLASEEIPEGGTNFNFTPQAGIGMTFALGDEGRSRLVTAVRWHHISNARIRGVDNNPGRDSVMGYIGISVPW